MSRPGNEDTAALKTLSRKAVYIPLAAFDNKVNGKCDPDAYMATRKSLPSSVQEKALVDFWHKIGVDYHRNATVKDSTNNGKRPIALSDMEERIRSRALTLIGGGINSSWDSSGTSGSSKSKKTIGKTDIAKGSRKGQAARKRERESRHLMHFSTEDETGKMKNFLTELNGMWNAYIFKLLQLPSKCSLVEYEQSVRDTKVWSRVTASITNETAQFIGARVRVKACRQSPCWFGKVGFLVGITKNTWNIMVKGEVSKNKKKRKRFSKSTAERDDEGGTSGNAMAWKAIVVPKRGSELTLLIPVDIQDNKKVVESHKSSVDSDDQEPKEDTVLKIDLREDL